MQKSINTVRSLAIDSIEKANSGHPGICMGAAPMAYTLFNHNLNVNPKNPNWINRDRFVLSAGHGSALLYSLLHLSGFDLTIEDLKSFRQVNSRTPGHPENMETKGVDVSTGPLGQGFAMAVGMAMSQKFLASKLNKSNFDIINHNTFVLCGDGDLMEGISYEAASLAGHLKLDKLIVLYDSNDISLDGELSLSFSENIQNRFKSQNWNVIKVLDGEDTNEIQSAINQAKQSDKPTLIEVKTIIGFGSNKKAGTSAVHGAPLGKEEMEFTKQSYSMPSEPFSVSKEVYEDFETNIIKRGKALNYTWEKLIKDYSKKFPKEYDLLQRIISNKKVDITMNSFLEPVASRVSSHHAINQIATQDELFLGGSADLSGSNNTTIKNEEKFVIDSDLGRNIYFGVREFAMGAILNGMNIHSGLSVFGSTFMVFSDYLKPAIRLSSLMSLPVTYVFTHDSVAVGEDGPTHQPVEQLAMFRSQPNLNVFRPCDSNETQAVWKIAYESKTTPSILALTRQNLKQSSDENIEIVVENVKKGAYVIKEFDTFDRIIIATGSEVEMAIEIAETLSKEGIMIRVVSMPCQELFDIQNQEYKDSILPKEINKIYSLEMLSPFGWEKYTKDSNRIFSINRFGLSGNVEDVKKELKFTKEEIMKVIKNEKK